MDTRQTAGPDAERIGLTSEEAAARLTVAGPNQVRVAGPAPLWKAAGESLTEPLVLLLLAVGILYLLLGELRDAVIILAVILTVAAVETWTEWRADRAVATLAAMAAATSQVWRDGSVVQLPPGELVPGDVVELAAGSRVPADAQLRRADELQIDESLVSGESMPVAKSMEPDRDRLLAGTLVVAGRGQAEVTATGASSTLGRLASLVAPQDVPRTPLQLHMAELARALLIVALAASIAVPLLGLLGGRAWREMLLTGLTLAFATIPEELPVLVVIVLGLGSLRLARRGAVVRRLVAAETLGGATVICTDKTGTLTRNHISLAAAIPAADLFADEGGAGSDRWLLAAARLASEHPGRTGFVDPLDAATWAAGGSADRVDGAAQERFPFDSLRWLQSGLGTANATAWLGVKGAPQAVLGRAVAWRDGDVVRPLGARHRQVALEASKAAARDGSRVLAVASREMDLPPAGRDDAERELVLEGLLVFADPIRPEVPGAVEQLRSAGVVVTLVTGDQAATARAIARAAGLDLPSWTGAELDGWDDGELAERAAAGAVFARTSPEHKLRIVRALERRGEVVAVTGDGVNDAPALQAAAIGVAMGRGGTDVAREAGDVVITDDNFATLAAAVAEGRRLYDNLRKAVRYYLAVKVALVLVTLLPTLLQLPLPFAPLQIVILELFMDLGASMAFVNQPAEGDVMRRPPRPRRARFLDRELLAGILGGGVLLALICGGPFAAGLRTLGQDGARTLAMAAWLTGHAALGVAMSSLRRLSLGALAANPALILWAVTATVFALTASLVAPLRELLHVGPAPFATVAVTVLGAAAVPLLLPSALRVRGSIRK